MGPLEDWRLLILAESAHGAGDAARANDTLATLVEEHSDSPIRGFAVQRAAEIAAENEDWDKALRWIEFSRSEDLAPDKTREIETLAWGSKPRAPLPSTSAPSSTR